MVSPGGTRARYAAALACEPECGCTFAYAAAEKFLRPIDRQLLGDVDVFATAVVTLARIAFGIFVGQRRPLCLEHPRARIVFGGDELDVLFLPHPLPLQRLVELGVETGDIHGRAEHAGLLGGSWKTGRDCSRSQRPQRL